MKPYVKTNKNDYIDAEAIAEAVGRPRMRFVPIKSDDRLDLQSVHRVRERWVTRRNSVINQIRGLSWNAAQRCARGGRHMEAALPGILEDDGVSLSGVLRQLLAQLKLELDELNQWVSQTDAVLKQIASESETCRRLLAIPGAGSITATAVIAAIGNGAAFTNGRQFAAWPGMVPSERSTGGKQKLLGINKRGDCYLRRLFVHGARAVLQQSAKQSSAFRAWLEQLTSRTHPNIVAVALANKLARMTWAVLAKQQEYRPPLLTGVRPVTNWPADDARRTPGLEIVGTIPISADQRLLRIE